MGPPPRWKIVNASSRIPVNAVPNGMCVATIDATSVPDLLPFRSVMFSSVPFRSKIEPK